MEEIVMTSEDAGLFGKTFDQQLKSTGGKIDGHDISPNRRIAGEIILEPLGSGVRVTARDSDHRVLWGFVASRETVTQVHCEIATYDTLQQLIADTLVMPELLPVIEGDQIIAAGHAVGSLEKLTQQLLASLAVIKVTQATHERARAIARIVRDAERQISIEVGVMKGMKSKTE